MFVNNKLLDNYFLIDLLIEVFAQDNIYTNNLIMNLTELYLKSKNLLYYDRK